VLVPFFAFIMWNSGLTNRPTLADYKDKLIVSVVDENPAANAKTDLITVRLENRTGKTWKGPKFQIESLDGEDKVLSVEHANEYNMVIAPHSSRLDTLSLRIVPAQAVAKRRVTLTDIDANRF